MAGGGSGLITGPFPFWGFYNTPYTGGYDNTTIHTTPSAAA